MKKLKNIYFNVGNTTFADNTSAIFFFYEKYIPPYNNTPKYTWDEDKLTINEAVVKYPPTEFNWINLDQE